MDINNEINKYNKYCEEFTEYVNELNNRSSDKMKEKFAELRGFKVDTVHESDIFYIGSSTEMLLPSYIEKLETFGVISRTNKKVIYHDRYIIPIKNIKGQVINLVGYSKEANERYIYGTGKYYRRRETLYGLENLELAYDMGYAILVEGITDAIRLRDMGYKNSFAVCGTHSSKFIMKQLNRCRHGVIKIPDRDSAGRRAVKGWECNRGVIINTFIKYKDIDDMCRESKENEDWAKQYIDSAINWIKSAEHNGFKSVGEEITMY